MTLDAERLRAEAEAERRIEMLQQNALTAEDPRRAVHVARLIRMSLSCRLKAAAAVADFERLCAGLREGLFRREQE